MDKWLFLFISRYGHPIGLKFMLLLKTVFWLTITPSVYTVYAAYHNHRLWISRHVNVYCCSHQPKLNKVYLILSYLILNFFNYLILSYLIGQRSGRVPRDCFDVLSGSFCEGSYSERSGEPRPLQIADRIILPNDFYACWPLVHGMHHWCHIPHDIYI